MTNLVTKFISAGPCTFQCKIRSNVCNVIATGSKAARNLLCRFNVGPHLFSVVEHEANVLAWFETGFQCLDLKGHSHEKLHMLVFGPIPQKIINKKYFQYTSSQNYLWQKSYSNEWFVAFSNSSYNLCMPWVLIMLFIRVIVTGVLVYYSNL